MIGCVIPQILHCRGEGARGETTSYENPLMHIYVFIDGDRLLFHHSVPSNGGGVEGQKGSKAFCYSTEDMGI